VESECVVGAAAAGPAPELWERLVGVPAAWFGTRSRWRPRSGGSVDTLPVHPRCGPRDVGRSRMGWPGGRTGAWPCCGCLGAVGAGAGTAHRPGAGLAALVVLSGGPWGWRWFYPGWRLAVCTTLPGWPPWQVIRRRRLGVICPMRPESQSATSRRLSFQTVRLPTSTTGWCP